MKTPGLQAEQIIICHIDKMHERPVVVGGTLFFHVCGKTPDALGKDLIQVSDVPDPVVVHYLVFIIVHKPAGKGVEIDSEGDKGDNDNGEKGGRFLLVYWSRAHFGILAVTLHFKKTIFQPAIVGVGDRVGQNVIQAGEGLRPP
jgi:hypothetical protein